MDQISCKRESIRPSSPSQSLLRSSPEPDQIAAGQVDASFASVCAFLLALHGYAKILGEQMILFQKITASTFSSSLSLNQGLGILN